MARLAGILGALLAVNASAESLANRDLYANVERLSSVVYSEALAEYDAAIAQYPGDVLLEIRRCEVIESFAYGEDFYVEAAEAEAETCMQAVFDKYPGNFEAELTRIQRDYGDTVLARLGQLHDTETWAPNRAHHARLEKLRSERSAFESDNNGLEEFYCIKALDFDLASDCRLLAADYYISRDDTASAIGILVSPLDPNEEPYHVVGKITKLANIGATEAAAAMMATLDLETLGDWWKPELATSLANAGLHDEAQRAIDSVADDYWQADKLARARHEIALQGGDYAAALTYYNELRDAGFANDPLLRMRLALFARDISLPWRARDLLGLLALVGTVLAIAAMAFLVPVIVHYRGLARRTLGLPAGLENSSWTLWHAGYGLFALIFGAVLVLYLFEYDLLASFAWQSDSSLADAENIDLPRLLAGESVLTALMLLPLLLTRHRYIELGARNWSILKCVGIGIACAIAFRLIFAVPLLLISEQFGFGESFTTFEAIAETYNEYGFWPVFLLVAILIPIVEEVVFRGVLLQGFARQITFGWSNAVQSLLFAAMHEQLLLLPFYFALAFAAGELTRRAGGLLPAIVLHAAFNGTAVLILAAMSSMVNGAVPG